MISYWRVSFFETWFQYFFCSAYTSQTWFYDASSGFWTRGPDMIEERGYHGCAAFWLNGEEIIAVSSGWSNRGATEFLNLSQENPQWIQGTVSHSWMKTSTIIEFAFKVQDWMIINMMDIKWYPMVTSSSTSTLLTTFSYVWSVHHSKTVIGSPWSKNWKLLEILNQLWV